MRRPAAVLLALWFLAAAVALLPLLTAGAGFSTTVEDAAGQRAQRWTALGWNSVRLALWAVAGALALAVPAAFALAELPPRLRGAAAALAALPLFVPPGVVAVGATMLLGAGGVLTEFLRSGAARPGSEIASAGWAADFAPVYTIAGAGLATAAAYAPALLACVLAGLRRASREEEDAAFLDGGRRAVWLAVRLPAAAPWTALGAALVFLLAVIEFSIPESLRALPVLAGDVYVQFGVRYDAAAALGAAGTLAALALAALLLAWPLLPRALRASGEDAADAER
ncbi:MAG: hypothetical protein SF028_02515, partial [Candidatus Sumerlaeia bacterium]|nr:hypothetical protein [Candidatus Sumerlaeia bacterium]